MKSRLPLIPLTFLILAPGHAATATPDATEQKRVIDQARAAAAARAAATQPLPPQRGAPVAAEATSAPRFQALQDEIQARRTARTQLLATGPEVDTTILGVAATTAPRALTSQLGLPEGMGLLVSSVMADSPATGVLLVDDLLVRLDDQKLIEPRQLAVLVRSYKAGDQVTVTYFRGGKEQTAKITLSQRPMPPLLSGVPEAYTVLNRELVDALKLSDLVEAESGVSGAIVRSTGSDRVEVQLPGDTAGGSAATVYGGSAGGAGGSTSSQVAVGVIGRGNGSTGGNATSRYSDSSGTVVIVIADGKKTVTIQDSQGNTTFTGPFQTEAERNAAPASVRARVEQVESRIINRAPLRRTNP